MDQISHTHISKEAETCPESRSCLRGCVRWLGLVTVEPVMFLYMFAFMLTTVVEQAFFVHKACRVNMNYSEHVCANLQNDSFADENKKVQVIVSNFHQYNNIASNTVPIFLALVIGSWSDRRGRKLPLLVGLAGSFYYSAMVVVIALQASWPVEVVIYAASLPAAMTGLSMAIFMAAFSYISDITTPQQRTIRVAILDVVYLATMPTGVALGKYLFNITGRSYAIMFTLNASLLAAAFLYALMVLEWRTTPRQESESLASTNCCADLFDVHHVVESVRTIVKKRPEHRRTYLIIVLICMALYTFQRDEKPMGYLYTILKFKWTADEYSDYRTFQSAAYVIGTLLGVPIMNKVLGLRDTVMVLVGAAAHALARVVFGLAEVPWLFYVGGTIVGLGPVAAPVLRSITSKLVPISERGKVFAVLSAADNAVPLFSAAIYTQVYNATINTFPAAIFWVTFGSQMIVFILMLGIHLSLAGRRLEAENDIAAIPPDDGIS
ncbi:probable peptidoglycan muropeptide transporter SLC46 isoform X2 [Bacillus rossius redtenbacheri]|uniref:probable peptidoglycan muropeptide transporter SLC46 isoform X2 n=1 Tax=Bacillus rossius redtenbacheri TaxID=93214 RepID=UPI002FDDBE63